MGRSWIPWTKGLETRHEVAVIADITGLSNWEVAARLMAVWSWVDSESQTGRMARYARATIDMVAQHNNFASAMERAGWLSVTDNAIAFPHWDRLHTETQKARLLAAERQRKHRSRKSNARTVTKTSAGACCNTVTVTGNEKDTPTEYLSPSPTAPIESARDPESTEDGKATKPPRKQNLVWNALCEIYGYADHRPPQSKLSRWGKIVRDLQGLSPPADPDEMKRLHRAMVESWDGREVSPEKFADWFPRFRAKEVEVASKPRLEEASPGDRAAELERQAKELFG